MRVLVLLVLVAFPAGCVGFDADATGAAIVPAVDASAVLAEQARLSAELNATRDELRVTQETMREAVRQRELLREGLKGARAERDAHVARADVLERRVDALEEETALLAEAARRIAERPVIHDGEVAWAWGSLRGETLTWSYPLASYKAHATLARPADRLWLPTQAGHVLLVADLRPYVTPGLFADLAPAMTDGRSDRDFVREVFHVKRNFVTYNLTLAQGDGLDYKYPAETMTEATGVCGDMSILLASLLLAGNAHADYGLKVSFWIARLDPVTQELTENPSEVNHAFVEVEFRDGERWFVETTGPEFYLYPQASGWRFPLN